MSQELGTALHYAVRRGYADRVEMLLKRGARPDVVDSTGFTALDCARMNGYEDMAIILSNWPTSEAEVSLATRRSLTHQAMT